MKHLTRVIIIVFIVSLVLTQAHSILRYFDESLARTKINIFWDKSYKREVTIQWYLYFLFLYFFFICCMFIGTMACIRYSFRLTMVFFTGMVYWFIKMILFLYNYDSGAGFDWVLVGAVALCLFFLILPHKETGKYKSME
jgi:hypothetical protein